MTTSLQINDVAQRSGFTSATLRYYEQIGLLPDVRRSANGYRRYDSATLDRLAFIARAKQLGCSLEETADLLTAWDGGGCGPVQDRLQALVRSKIAAAEASIAQLQLLADELRVAAAALEVSRPVGACDETCGCLTVGQAAVADPVAAGPLTTPVIFGARVATSVGGR